MKWVEYTDDEDRESGCNICPVCGGDLEALVDDEEIVHKERCVKGCYVFNFDTDKREK